MKTRLSKIAVIVISLSIVFCENVANACSTFCLRADGRIVFGKNYDWNVEDGMLMVNKSGATHASGIGAGKDYVPASWTSRFGSVTFNQYGRNSPSGGINEAGLVIELMWADGSRYPRRDSRPAVGCLEWIQYQLDTAGTVDEVIASDSKVRIESEVPLHYLVADRKGRVATIEFIGGKLVAGGDLPVAALTNDLYKDSLRFLEKTSWIPTDAGSRARFIRAANHVKSFQSGDAVAYAFQSLADLSSAITQWSIVYEIDRGQVHFRTQSNPQIRTLDLKTLDFSCGSPVMVFDLKANIEGDVRAHLQTYSRDLNFELIRSTFRQTDFMADTPQAELQRIASLPDASRCQKQ